MGLQGHPRMMGGCQPNLAAPHQGSPLQYARGSCERAGTTQGEGTPHGKNGLSCLCRARLLLPSPVPDDAQTLAWRSMQGPPSRAFEGATGHLRAQYLAHVLRWFGWT